MNNGFEFETERRVIPPYLVSGEVYGDHTTKHGGIKKLYDVGLPIPPTLVLGNNFNEDILNAWIEEYNNLDFIIRTSSYLDVNTGTESNREPSREDLESSKLKSFVNPEQCILVQALPENSIDRNSLSGVCLLSEEIDKSHYNWKVECAPDIATLTNRLSLTPWWIVNYSGRNYEIEHNRPESRDLFLKYIKYRVGRSMLKERGIKVPRLEKIEANSDEWKQTINYCEKNLHLLSENHSLIKLLDSIESTGIENLLPRKEDLEELGEKHGKLSWLHRTLIEKGYHERTRVKFSFSGNQLYCWSIIGANEIKTLAKNRPDTIKYSYHSQYYKGR